MWHLEVHNLCCVSITYESFRKSGYWRPAGHPTSSALFFKSQVITTQLLWTGNFFPSPFTCEARTFLAGRRKGTPVIRLGFLRGSWSYLVGGFPSSGQWPGWELWVSLRTTSTEYLRRMEAPDQKEVAVARREAWGFLGGHWLKLHHIISQPSHVYLLPP